MRSFSVASLLSLVPLVAGHGAVTSYTIAGKAYPGYEGFSPASGPPTIQWQWSDYNPVTSVSDIKMRCNGGKSAPLTAEIQAGTNITANWKQWTHAQGPVMVWMYPCEADFKACTGEKEAWFKVEQMGYYGKTNIRSEDWGTTIVMKTLKWSTKIPTNLKPGNYLIRHELLALHQSKAPQFYPECAQLVVKGSGTALPPASYLKKIPGYAPQNDPGVTVDIDMNPPTTYTCPGGAVWDGFQ